MQKVTMVRLPAEKACYIANSIDETLTPADLKEALEMVSVLSNPKCKCVLESPILRIRDFPCVRWGSRKTLPSMLKC